MIPLDTFDLLESMLAGHTPTATELDDLLKTQTREDQYLEYKHGKLLEDRTRGRIIREYVTGFANSTGGILIIGVDEDSWSVTGAEAPGGSDLRAWASKCLTPIVAQLSPGPRFYMIDHPQGNVLVIAVHRSSGLIPCTESGELVYYLRLHDQMLPAPPYLMTDLMLGRRQHPYLRIVDVKVEFMKYRISARTGDLNFELTPHFIVENQGLTRAEDVTGGIITCQQGTFPALNSYLLSYVEVRESDTQVCPEPCGLLHKMIYSREVIYPFIRFSLDAGSYVFPLKRGTEWHQYEWRAAVYLISSGAPPMWHQLTVSVNRDAWALTPDLSRPIAAKADTVHIKQLSGQRPIVQLEML